MKTYNTNLGPVEIHYAQIMKGAGYDEYDIVVDIEFNGESKKLRTHTTNSRLWDEATDEDIAVNGSSDYLLENASGYIEEAIDEYINSL